MDKQDCEDIVIPEDIVGSVPTVLSEIPPKCSVCKERLGKIQQPSSDTKVCLLCNRYKTVVGRKKCLQEGCLKMILVPYCKVHRRDKPVCQHEGCSTPARGSPAIHCQAHGGGRRCDHENCTKASQGATPYCKAHGGGRLCENKDCTTSAAGKTPFCKAHGGGRRCEQKGCTKSARDCSNHCKAPEVIARYVMGGH